MTDTNPTPDERATAVTAGWHGYTVIMEPDPRPVFARLYARGLDGLRRRIAQAVRDAEAPLRVRVAELEAELRRGAPAGIKGIKSTGMSMAFPPEAP